ncbi:MAG: hypothetical protein KatS3mg034_1134 [Vicingaceae bacterium]|nr:MAG: hypothetical protein KatS3mg034_1134 [Vicingaceae bacterium]
MKKNIFIYLLAFSTFIFCDFSDAYATHLAAGDLTYCHVSGNTYKFRLTLVRDCSPGSAGLSTTASITLKSSCTGSNIPVTLNCINCTGSSGQQFSLGCLQNPPCREEFIYEGTANVPVPCNDWTFYYSSCCRNTTNNIVGQPGQYIEATLNNAITPKNCSPKFNSQAIGEFCVGNLYYYDVSAYDPDGDSLSYGIICAKELGATPTCVPYQAGYSAQNPLPTNPPLNMAINPSTGIVTFTPTQNFIGVVVFEVTEWRKDTNYVPLPGGGYDTVITYVKIGSIMRDLQVTFSNQCVLEDLSFNAQLTGYPIDLDGKEYTVFNCADTAILFRLSTAIQCASIEPGGSDFRLVDSATFSNPFPIKAAYPANCVNGSTDSIYVTLWQPLPAGTYYLIVKNGNDYNTLTSKCGLQYPVYSDSLGDTLKIKVPPAMTLNLGPDIAVCVPSNSPPPIYMTMNTDSSIWYYNSNSVGQNLTSYQPTEAGQLVVNAWLYGCKGTDTVNVIFNQDPIFDIQDFYSCVGSLDTTIVAPIQGASYLWKKKAQNGNFLSISNSNSLDLSIGGEGTYTLKITTAAGCSYTDTFNVYLVPNIQVSLGPDQTTCEKGTVLTVDFKDGSEYTWYFNGQLQDSSSYIFEVSYPGTYVVNVEAGYGCKDADTVNVNIITRPQAPVVKCRLKSGDLTLFYWDPIPNATGYEVSYDSGMTWIQPYTEDGHSHIAPIDIQKIWVRALTNDVCYYGLMGESEECEAELIIPNVVTPNGDGINDYFVIPYLALYPGSKLVIYNRWGKKIYESDDYKNNWDGSNYSAGTYYFILTRNDGNGTVYKGYFTLLK